MPGRTITLPAHAKVNLALSVGPPTPPKGYHPIASWFAPIGLHDTVGPKAIGAALEWIESKKEERRVNRVRYFEFATLKKALLAGAKRPPDKAAIDRCLP